MFDNGIRYASAGIGAVLDIGTQNLLWLMIDDMEVAAKDYLQVFELTVCSGGRQKIIHTQERPTYRNEVVVSGMKPIAAKIYVIDDSQRITMLLADEY